MTSSNKVGIVVYLGKDSDGQPIGHRRLSRDIGYSELISELYKLTKINKSQYGIKVYGALCVNNITQSIELTNDEDVWFFFAPDTGNPYVNLHVETEEVQSNTGPDIPISSEYYQYASYLRGDDIFAPLIVTQGLENLGINDFGGGTSRPYEFADGPSENIGRSDIARTTEIRENDPVVDIFGADEHQDSEPDDSGSSSHTDDDDCDIDSIRAGYNQTAEGSTPTEQVAHLPPSYMHPTIPFFSATYPEQLVDSFQIPKKQRFYDSSEGELAKGMVFTDKKKLQFAVKDFSVRVARREYMVVESTPSIWKVKCKNNETSAQCNWLLRAGFKKKIGLWQITKYGVSQMSHEFCFS